jgi:hypothetical protein
MLFRSLAQWTCSALLIAPVLAQTTWYVDVDSPNDPGSGTQGDPYRSIQYAINEPATQGGDTLEIAAGVYPENVELSGKHLILRGAEGATHTVVDGQGLDPCLRIDGYLTVGTIVRDLTLQDGRGLPGSLYEKTYWQSGGGGLWARDTGVLLRHVHFLGNEADVGGDGFLQDTSASFEDCIFGGESNGYGGGALFVTGGQLKVLRGSFEFCRADEGGAMRLRDTTARVLDSTFLGDAPDPFGHVSHRADGIHGSGSALLLHRCHFRDMDSDDSASAIYWAGGQLTVTECRFEHCWVGEYGGTICIVGANVYVGSTVFHGMASSRGWGGGIYSSGSQLLVEDTEFRGGYAAEGGAVSLWAGQAEFRDCRFVSNTSQAYDYWETGNGGAAMLRDMAAVHFERCVFDGNVAYGKEFPYDWIGEGGAVEGPATFAYCTFAGNRAYDPAGGSGLGGAVSDALSLSHCIVWGNGPTALHDVGSVTWSDVEGGWTGTGNFAADPFFWFEDDRHLRPGSPCIDAGDPNEPPDDDGSRADVGAYSFDPDYYPPPSVYCVAKPSASGCVPAIGSYGSPTLTGPDDFHVQARSLPPHRLGVLVWSPDPDQAPFWDGFLCVDTTTATNSLPLDSGPGSPCGGGFDLQFTQAQMVGAGWAAGDALYAQFWFRDPAGAGALGLTNALRFVIQP